MEPTINSWQRARNKLPPLITYLRSNIDNMKITHSCFNYFFSIWLYTRTAETKCLTDRRTINIYQLHGVVQIKIKARDWPKHCGSTYEYVISIGFWKRLPGNKIDSWSATCVTCLEMPAGQKQVKYWSVALTRLHCKKGGGRKRGWGARGRKR